MLHRKLVYLKIYKGYFLVRIVGESEEHRFECSGLEHPRTLAGDFEAIEKDFQKAFKNLWSWQMRIIKPKVLVHLIPKQEGGVTPIELRVFREAAAATGQAGFVLMLTGDKYGPLDDEQLRELL